MAADFSTILGLPIVMLGFTPPDDNAHAPNESMDLTNYELGIRCVARMWDELAERRDQPTIPAPEGPVRVGVPGQHRCYDAPTAASGRDLTA